VHVLTVPVNVVGSSIVNVTRGYVPHIDVRTAKIKAQQRHASDQAHNGDGGKSPEWLHSTVEMKQIDRAARYLRISRETSCAV
jgi:hypothetical protein